MFCTPVIKCLLISGVVDDDDGGNVRVFLPVVPSVHFVVAAFSDIYAHLRKANFETDSAARLVADYEQFMLQQVG